jgi:WD40 repeat protein
MVKLSDEGKILADKARKQAGFTNKQKLYKDKEDGLPNGLSLGTVKRFWRQESISIDSFIIICKAIKIDDWCSLIDWRNDTKNWKTAELKDELNPYHHQGVGALAVMTNNNEIILASGSYDSTINIWKIKGDRVTHLKTLAEHKKDVSSLIFIENQLISGSYDRTIKTWNTASWECIDTIENGHNSEIECLALTTDDQYLFVSSCNSLEIYLWVWDLNPKKLLYKLQEHKTGRLYPSTIANAVLGLVVNHNTVISSGMDGRLISWQISNEGDKVIVIPTLINDENSLELRAITSSAISPDREYLAVGENSKQITIWDIAKKSLVYNTQGKHDFPNILALAYHPTGKILASASFDADNPIIRLWNPHNGDIVTTLTTYSHSSPIRSLIFSPDGKMLIAGDEEGHIFLWGV